jgi:hypothetical protein
MTGKDKFLLKQPVWLPAYRQVSFLPVKIKLGKFLLHYNDYNIMLDEKTFCIKDSIQKYRFLKLVFV